MSNTLRFRLDREIGHGTTGHVWHGVLVDDFGPYRAGFEVAVKYLRPELEEDPRARRAFEAEAEAGLAVMHPALVHLIHEGVDARGRFLVMPYVPGAHLREVMEREKGSLPEPLVRSIARQVAGGLAALHAAGYVHGDVKPENIRLDAEGHAVLLDLGFARRVDDATTQKGRSVAPRPGSLAYVASEQARGESGTQASDVFSLGVVVYELVTGLHPFAGFARTSDAEHGGTTNAAHAWIEGGGSSGVVARAALEKPDADKLLAAIATARFVPPSRFVPQISPFLDRILQDVLQRDPARRPTASELAQRLVDQETGAWWRGEIGFEPGARRGGTGEIDARHQTPLVGRDSEMSALFAAFESAVNAPGASAGAGGVVWVRGAAGSGKSRLVHEFASRARTSVDPPLYLYGRCRELDEERPCEPVLRMLERYLRLPPNIAPKKREIDELSQLVPPRVAEALAQALDPEFAGTVVLSVPVALATWLTALGRRVPLIVYLDDVNWAGSDTLAVIGHVAEHMKGARILLVLGSRDGMKSRAGEAFDAVRERLAANVPVTEVALGPLDEESVLALVRQLFHHSAPRLRLAHVLWQRSRGNPGLIVELLRGLLARGEARPHADGEPGAGLELSVSPDDLPLPGSLRKAIAESYRRLPALDRAWLRRLAVVGGRIETEFLIAAFPGEKRPEIDAMLARLVRSDWLTATAARYRFARPALREAVYRSLSREQRVKLHTAAAAALEPREGLAPTLEDAFQRAFHLRAAGDHATLLAVLRPLLARLLKSGQPQRVHPLSQWGLEAVAHLPRSKDVDRMRIDLLEAAADASDRLGIREDQRAILDQLTDLEFDPDLDPEAIGRVYILHGRYAVSTGQYGLARGMLRNAVDLFVRAGADSLRSEALRRLSLVQSHVGELAEANKLAKAALDSSQSEPQRALAHLALGVIDVLEDRVEPAMENADRALSILRSDPAFNLPGIFAAAYLLRARIYRSSGTPSRALASANRAVRLARVAGERRLEAEAMARLGGLLLDGDRPDEAEARLREALLLAEEIEDRRGQALSRLFLGILLWENDDAEASLMLARAANLAVEMGLNRVEALAAAIRSRIFREGGDIELALEWSARAMSLLDRFGAELADRIAITGTRALVLRTAGEASEADSLEKKLDDRLRRENARIRSPLLRLRHKRVSERLVAAVLSPEGPVYPRIRIDVVEDASE